jgi:hypothetical protein
MITVEDVKTAPVVAAIVLMANPRRDVKMITAEGFPRLVKWIDRGDAYYTVDGYRVEQPGLAAAVAELNKPPRPSPEDEVERELEKLRKGPPPKPEDLAKEIARELKERRRVYLPKVKEGKMSPALMARRIWMMECLEAREVEAASKSDLFGGSHG